MEFVFDRKKLSWISGILLALAFSKLGLCSDATSFDPTTVAVTSQSTIAVGTVIAWPSGSNPADMAKWLECNGQGVPAGNQYDRLRAVLGGQPVPNYNGQFLRGTTVVAQVGQQVSDSIRSHHHAIDPHDHGLGGAWANSQTSWFTRTTVNHMTQVTWLSDGVNAIDGVSYETASSATSGGGISGRTDYGGGGQTHDTGGSETAPVHTKVRYLIRAIQ